MARSLRILVLGTLVATVTSALPLLATPALASELDKKGRSDAKEAMRFYKEGNYEDAAKLFVRLSIAYPDMLVFVRNLGACYYYMRRYEPALSNLRDYLHRKTDIDATDRAEVSGWIGEMERLRDLANAPAPTPAPAPAPAAAAPAPAPAAASAPAPAPVPAPLPSMPTAPAAGAATPAAPAPPPAAPETPAATGAPPSYPPTTQYPAQPGYPPPGQYGAPAQGQYGAPAQGQYGAPYGALPQGQYGTPAQGQYGAPPEGQYAPQPAYPPPGQYPPQPSPGPQYTSTPGQGYPPRPEYAPAGAAPVGVAAQVTPPPSSGSGRKVAAWLIGITGVGALAAGGVFTYLALDKFDKVETKYDPAQEKSGKNYVTASGICYGIGGAAIVTAIIIGVTGGSSGQVALAPAVGPGVAGATLSGSF
jgi:hypothetical protein